MKSIYEFLFSEHLLNEHLLKNKTVASTQGNDYVDLGLPSGLLWAKCNIGADEPYEYGDYFMWGSTEPDTHKPCDWVHAPFNDGSIEFNKEYFRSMKNKICPNGILAPKYDGATVILGDDWMLPTKEDFQELLDNTECEWVKNYQDSGIAGKLLMANGDDIFIPAAGYRSGSSFYYRDELVYLWSSSIKPDNSSYAYNFYIKNDCCFVSSNPNKFGFCLRAVRK